MFSFSFSPPLPLSLPLYKMEGYQTIHGKIQASLLFSLQLRVLGGCDVWGGLPPMKPEVRAENALLEVKYRGYQLASTSYHPRAPVFKPSFPIGPATPSPNCSGR